jgi:hypothetical protein
MTTPALLANYLFIAPLLEARLQEQIVSVPVEAIEQLAQAGAEDARPTVIYLLWDGDQFGDSTPRGTSQIVSQRWLALLYQRHMSPNDKDARAQAAGRHLSSIHKAVAGWKPEGCERPFRRAQGRSPSYSKTSGLFPLTFEIDLHL